MGYDMVRYELLSTWATIWCATSCLEVARHRLPDLLNQLVAHHIVAHVDSRRGAFGIRTAVAFYHDSVETEEHATVRFARIHLIAQRAKRLPRKQIAKTCRQGAIH